jgi:exonuclease SbcD
MRTVRIVHTSDLHLDTSFAGSGFPSRLGDRKREAIRAALRRILETARDEQADLVLIAGDLFEHERITPDTVEFLKRQLESVDPIRVFIAPGNHDPFLRGSPYHDERWPPNVHVFREEEFRSVELPDLGARVTGFGFNGTFLTERHFARLRALPDDAVNIVVSHGSDVGSAPVGKSQHGPFEISEVAGKNIDYCALGHYHQQRQVRNPIDRTQAWYCGIPEGRGWDEQGSLGFLRVDIAGREVSVRNVPCNRYPLQTVEIDCRGFSTREQVVESLLLRRGAGLDPSAIVRVRLTGSVDPRLELSFREIEERLAGEALHFHWEDCTSPEIDFDSAASENTLRGRFARRLRDEIARASDPLERAELERARLYGLEALAGRAVRRRSPW